MLTPAGTQEEQKYQADNVSLRMNQYLSGERYKVVNNKIVSAIPA